MGIRVDRSKYDRRWHAKLSRALITGATGSFGGAIAKAFRQHGIHLLLAGRSQTDLQRVKAELEGIPSGPASVDLVPADLASQKDRHALARIIREKEIDILVHAAGIQGPIGPSWESDYSQWQQTFEVTLFAAVELCGAAATAMPARGGGKIICLSGGGAAGPRPGFAAYASAKTALVRYCECLATETRDLGVDVNCVAPGAALTRLTEAIRAAGDLVSVAEHHAVEAAAGTTPQTLQRAAQLCVFLASPVSNGITGKLISAVWDPWLSLNEHGKDLRDSDVYTLRRIVPKDRGMTWGNNQ